MPIQKRSQVFYISQIAGVGFDLGFYRDEKYFACSTTCHIQKVYGTFQRLKIHLLNS